MPDLAVPEGILDRPGSGNASIFPSAPVATVGTIRIESSARFLVCLREIHFDLGIPREFPDLAGTFMGAARFSPGFRFSSADAAGLVSAAIIGGFFFARDVWSGVGVCFVVIHFFLFCNVFRIPRKQELIWASCFLILSFSTLTKWEVPGWIPTYGICVALAVVLIVMEIRKPGYHGIFWERWNPNLPEWWRARHLVQASGEKSEAERSDS